MITKLLYISIQWASSLIKIGLANILYTLSVSKALCTAASESAFTFKEPVSIYLKYLPRFGIVARSA